MTLSGKIAASPGHVLPHAPDDSAFLTKAENATAS